MTSIFEGQPLKTRPKLQAKEGSFGFQDYIYCMFIYRYEISYEGFTEFTCVKIITSRSLHCLTLLQLWNPLSQPNQAVKKGPVVVLVNFTR